MAVDSTMIVPHAFHPIYPAGIIISHVHERNLTSWSHPNETLFPHHQLTRSGRLAVYCLPVDSLFNSKTSHMMSRMQDAMQASHPRGDDEAEYPS